MVMLADTDAGSIITAGQSGASWGYRLLPLEILLIPVLYLVMEELTVRLGTTTGKGHAEAIRDRFGARWAWLSVSTLLLSATGALVTEFAGIAGVGALVGLSPGHRAARRRLSYRRRARRRLPPDRADRPRARIIRARVHNRRAASHAHTPPRSPPACGRISRSGATPTWRLWPPTSAPS